MQDLRFYREDLMQSFTKELWFNTKHGREFINITGEFDGQRRKRVLVKIIGE
jgi:thiamine phosphate synthase YjbQ (UPF0047 family)